MKSKQMQQDITSFLQEKRDTGWRHGVASRTRDFFLSNTSSLVRWQWPRSDDVCGLPSDNRNVLDGGCWYRLLMTLAHEQLQTGSERCAEYVEVMPHCSAKDNSLLCTLSASHLPQTKKILCLLFAMLMFENICHGTYTSHGEAEENTQWPVLMRKAWLWWPCSTSKLWCQLN